MKVLSWVVALLVILTLSGAAAFAEEPAPATKPEAEIFRLNKKNLDRKKGQKQKAADEAKAKEDEKSRELEKKAKIDKVERKTGNKAKSWQVLNR